MENRGSKGKVINYSDSYSLKELALITFLHLFLLFFLLEPHLSLWMRVFVCVVMWFAEKARHGFNSDFL